jgi:hypothetical protein
MEGEHVTCELYRYLAASGDCGVRDPAMRHLRQEAYVRQMSEGALLDECGVLALSRGQTVHKSRDASKPLKSQRAVR